MDATLYRGVCTAASRSNEGTGRAHAGQRASSVEGEAKDSMNESCVETSREAAVCEKVCVATSKDGVGTGSGGRRGSVNKDAMLQKCSKGELRGSLSERS